MIYGLIPIGGKGKRLGLPYSKEMLPQKNFNFFNPLVNHTVTKMKLAGAEKIYFIHGTKFKKDVKDYYQENMYLHVIQNKAGFANVIFDFFKEININDNDKIIFGLPDSIYDSNPFIELVNKEGIAVGLFVTDDYTFVDRLNLDKNIFQVKTLKTKNNLNLFWGVLKFDGADIKKMVKDNVFNLYTEVGDILNLYEKNYVECGSYLDLGTWENYNRYISNL